MRAVTYNIHWATLGKGPTVDLERCAAVCRGLDADVIGLQEVDQGVPRSGAVDQTAVLAERTFMAGVFGTARRRRGSQWGNALLVRGQIESWSVVRLPRVERRRMPRSVLLADVVLDRPQEPGRSGELSVVVSHLGVRGDEQALQLPALLRVAADPDRPDRPRVLMMDANTDIAGVTGVLARHGWQVVTAGGSTYPAGPKRRIDHIATVGLDPISASAPESPISDHRPLVVDL